MLMNDLYLSPGLVTCFDEFDPSDPPADPPSTPPADPPADPPAGGLPQDKVNEILAKERRKHQQALQQQEKMVKELLEKANLTDQQRKEWEANLHTLQEQLVTTQGQLRSKEQEAVAERKKLEETFQAKITEMERRASEWENRYRKETVYRSLYDAGNKNDAYNADQIVTILLPMSKLVEDVDDNGKPKGTFKTVVEFPDVDPTTGDLSIAVRSPEDTVKRMKELVDYQNLFRSNVVSGLGSNSSTAGIPTGATGKPDLARIARDPQQYRKLRQERPDLFNTKSR